MATKKAAAKKTTKKAPATTANKSATKTPGKRAVDARAQAAATRERLAEAIPKPRLDLDWETPWQLLIATILAAQSTDETINKVTPLLFRTYPTPAALGAAPQEEVEAVVKSTGFFRNKAKAIREASRMIAERFGGETPNTLEGLVSLPGVARKTATTVLGNALGVTAGITVDTHALRVSGRLGLTQHDEPEKIEADLCALFSRETWVETGVRLQLHGRYMCTARAPRCPQCPLNEICPSREADPEGSIAERAAAERRRVESRGNEA
jgi:endonuclease-3